MRTIDRLSPKTALARLHALVGRLARSLSARHAVIRWGLVLTVVGAFLVLGYWAATTFSTVSVRYLASGARFSSEDLIKICRAFDEHRITDYRLDDRRVAVAADDFDEAAVLLAKSGVGRHSIEEIRSQPGAMSLLWETSEDRTRRDQLKRERILEAMIGQQSGVVWSLVSIHHSRAAAGLRTPPKPSAFVYLETEGDRQLPFRTVQAIPAILRGYEPDLNMHAITVMDRRGHRYLDPSNPSLGDISRDRAREEELSEKILEKLDWIKGVRVLVQVSTPQHIASPTGRGSSSPLANPPRAADRSVSNDGNAGPGSAGPAAGGGAPAIVVNGPADLETEPVPTKPIAATPVSNESAGAAFEPDHESGHVLVNVPRSFYYNALVNKADHIEPSPEEFQLMAARTETGVKKTVEPRPAGAGNMEGGCRYDPRRVAVSSTRGLALSRRIAPQGIGLGNRRRGGSGDLDTGCRWIVDPGCAAPARPPQPEAKTARYRTDPRSEPGPSERVRELVRRNPEAAASVLQRWTVGGGSAS